MDIGDYLVAIREGYNTESTSSRGHRLLSRAKEYIGPLVPGGLVVRASGGMGRATTTPWIAILDPDETVSPQQGIYLVYIFRPDLNQVVLTLNQGITDRVSELGRSAALIDLRNRADAIREDVGEMAHDDLRVAIDFGHRGFRQQAYAAGNIFSKTYEVRNLPDEDVLESDLADFLRLYQAALIRRDAISPNRSDLTGASSSLSIYEDKDFRPKDDHDYVQQLVGREIRKSRRHETLVSAYGTYAMSLGFRPSTAVHPRDLTLTKDGNEWLVEAKVIYLGNATEATRGAFAQLATYSHFLYRNQKPLLLALFTEPIGPAYVNFLEANQIAVVWKGDLGWEGSPTSIHAGLV